MQKSIVEGFRLSPQQKRLWQLMKTEQRAPQAAQCTLTLKGDLNALALRAALVSVISRHEILRTAFHSLPAVGFPLQVITDGAMTMADSNLSGMGEEEQRERIERLLAQDRERPWEYEAKSLLRLRLARLSMEEHSLLVTLPTLCADSRTLSLFAEELATAYGEAAGGGAGEAGETMQYADVSEWQNELLEGEGTAAGRAYWREQDWSACARLRLPFEGVRRSAGKAEIYAGRQALELSEGESRELAEAAREHGVGVGTWLQACWQVLLWRLSGEPEEFALCVVNDGRKYETLANGLGPLARLLPMRLKMRNGQSFSEVVDQTEKARREAAKWQALFGWDAFKPESTDTAAPTCAAQFEHEVLPTIPPAAGVSFILKELSACAEPYKFKLRCIESDSKPLRLEIHWDSEILSSSDADILSEELRAVIGDTVRDSSQTIDKLSLLNRAQWEQRLARWNNTGEESIRAKRIHEVFEEQVERTPVAVAALYEGERVTYDELNRRANQTAHYLRRLGVGPDVLVGLMIERSIELVVAMLGVLKAGGAYLPLDSAYPSERISFMLEDSAVNVLLTQESLIGNLPSHDAHVARHVVRMDTDREILAAQSAENPPHAAAAANLAYVIYTSGSTGKPKGVMISHGAICNRLLWMVKNFPLTAQDRVLQKTPISFDASVWEFFAPLLAGAQLVMARPGGHQDGAYLRKTVGEEQITTIQLVPSMLQVFLDGADLTGCNSLKRVFCGGETLPFKLQERFFANLDASLHNLYGPTEVSIDASCWICQRDSNLQFVPIGHALANTQIYILDAELNPLPTGVAGELFVGGDGLARGYLNQPDLTAERFIPHPFGSQPGLRLYRTGDLARYLSDGSIEYLGRLDHQVKIRGFRIELGEVEATLRQHPAVRQAVVTVSADVSGEKRLAAYLVAAEGSRTLNTGELRAHLRQRLPDYMLPSLFVWLDQLPLTANGKIDRGALPRPEQMAAEPKGTDLAPRTQMEELIADIWSEVLGLKQVGVEENFFEVGGHSLMAAQIISRMREACGVEVALRSLFEAPRVRDLAARVEMELRAREGGGNVMGGQAPPLRRVTAEGEEMALSFAQQRLWFLDQLESNSSAYNIPCAVRLSGELNVAAMERTLNEIVRRHEALRTVFINVKGEPRQVVKAAVGAPLEVEDLSGLAQPEREAEARVRAMDEAQRPFDLARGPLLRAKLLRLGEEEHALLLTMHHIVSDGWSAGVLIREVGTLYEAFCGEQESPLEELEIQYADYAVWQRGWMAGDVLEEQLRYWRRQMEGAPRALELPADRPRPLVQSFRGASHYHELSTELTESIRELSRKEGVTLFMLTLAAFQTLLRRYTGNDDIVVGADIANRNHTKLEKLIGLFANQIALRADLSGDPTFREFLRRVRHVVLGAYAHQDLPFEKVVSALLPQRDMSRNPIFQVMFVMQNTPMPPLHLAGITISPIKIDNRMAKFDLVLFAVEKEEGLTTVWNYNTDLFDEGTVTRLALHYETLLRSIAADPDARLDKLQILTEAERLQRIEEKKERQESRHKRFTKVAPKALDLAGVDNNE